MHLHADEATIVSLTFIGRIAMGPADASRGPLVYSEYGGVGSNDVDHGAAALIGCGGAAAAVLRNARPRHAVAATSQHEQDKHGGRERLEQEYIGGAVRRRTERWREKSGCWRSRLDAEDDQGGAAHTCAH